MAPLQNEIDLKTGRPRFGSVRLPFGVERFEWFRFSVPAVPQQSLKKREGVPEMGTKPLKALRGYRASSRGSSRGSRGSNRGS